MNRFRVLVKRIEVYEVTLEAPNSWQASELTHTLSPQDMIKLRDEREATPLQEYGPISVQSHQFEGVLVFNTPMGAVFEREDIEDILSLVAEHVGPVESYWNGLRCTTFSVKTETAATETIALEAQEEAVRDALQRRFERSIDAKEIAAKIKRDLDAVVAETKET